MRRPMALAAVMAIALLNPALLPSAGSAERVDPSDAGQIATRLVQHRPARFGVTRADVANLAVTDAYRSTHTAVTHVYLQQRLDGRPVRGSSMTVNVTPDGKILSAGSRLVRNLASASGRPALGPVQAASAAARGLGLEPTRPFTVLEAGAGPEQTTLLSPGGISLQPISAHLVYESLRDGRIRLAWNLEIEEVSEQHWWNVSVDAETGRLLMVDDYVDHERARRGTGPDGASYRVYALPLESPNDGERTLVKDPADLVASPFGWHDTNGADGAEFTTTEGNTAHAYLDTFNAGMGVPMVTDANGGQSLTFDFAFNPDNPPTVNKDAAATNLFYWNNIIHDVFYGYGFDEAAGNFQVNNYGRGGAGNDSVRAEAQDGSGVNNANFATPADGSRPRMQMYVWTSTFTQNRRLIDGDFDSGVIIHEYGHGISNRLTGGPSRVDCLRNQEQMGEGWSDWLAIALLAREGDTGPQPRGMGTYVLGQPNRQARGIRPSPYSTDTRINRATYDTIKTAAVPHGVGYVWATMLWEVFWNLVDKHGFNPHPYGDWSTGGNNLAIQLVMDGMKFQPCSPGFVDGRDAILTADAALTGGLNQCEIWAGFSKRGLGFSAKQGSSSSRSDGIQSFDTHPDCVAA
jgi:extracellular elastinolytic metalloproteinase